MNYLYVIHAATCGVHTCRTLHEAIALVEAYRNRLRNAGHAGSVKLTVLTSTHFAHGPFHHHHTVKFPA